MAVSTEKLINTFNATIYRVYCVDKPSLFFLNATTRSLEDQMEIHILDSFDPHSELRLDQEMRKRAYKRFRIEVIKPVVADNLDEVMAELKIQHEIMKPILNE